MGSWVHGFIRAHGFTGSWVHGFALFRLAWLGFVLLGVAWLCLPLLSLLVLSRRCLVFARLGLAVLGWA